MFMVGEQLKEGMVVQPSDSDASDVPGSYKVAEKEEMTRFGKLFHQTGRLQGADSYLWISAFIRYLPQLNIKKEFGHI